MVASAAKTVTEYLASLPPERRKEMAAVRRLVKTHLPLAALGEVIAAIPPGMLILRHEELVKGRGR